MGPTPASASADGSLLNPNIPIRGIEERQPVVETTVAMTQMQGRHLANRVSRGLTLRPVKAGSESNRSRIRACPWNRERASLRSDLTSIRDERWLRINELTNLWLTRHF